MDEIIPGSDIKGTNEDIELLPEDSWKDVDISSDWLDPTDEWESAKNSLFIGDAPICTLGGLTLLTGQSGNGKTMTLAMLMSAIFRGEYGQFRRSEEIENPVVLYVDTEMEKYNTQRLMNRVYFLNGWEFKTIKPQFRILRLRDTVSTSLRWRKVLKSVYEVNPTFCILDGLLDLVEDFNDNKECQALIRKLMTTATWYDVSVIGVIHQNPGGEKMAGHLGSFGERKAVTVLMTKKDKNGDEVIFKVDQKKARDKDAEDCTFKVQDDRLHIGIPMPLLQNPTEVKSDEQRNKELRDIMNKYVHAPAAVSKTRLRDEIKVGERIGSTKAWQLIDEAIARNVLEVTIDSKLRVINNPLPFSPSQEEAPY